MEVIKGMRIISIGDSPVVVESMEDKWKKMVAHRYAICRTYLKLARHYLQDGTVDQFWDAMQGFIKSRKVARTVRRMAQSSRM